MPINVSVTPGQHPSLGKLSRACVAPPPAAPQHLPPLEHSAHPTPGRDKVIHLVNLSSLFAEESQHI